MRPKGAKKPIIPPNLPLALGTLYMGIMKFNVKVEEAIPMEKAFCGIEEHVLYVGNEDIVQFFELDEMGASCISLYIR